MIDLFSIFKAFGGQNGFVQRLTQFGQNYSQNESLSPEQKVREMLKSGEMTQEQFNVLSSIATQITGKGL